MFKSPARKDVFGDTNPERPGPQEYAADVTKDNKAKKEGGSRRPFGMNQKRWKAMDNGVPGPVYNLPDSLKVADPKHEHASYRSGLERGLDLVHGRDNPGIGEYDTQHHRTIANKEFQGGAANNFVLFTRLSNQASSPQVAIKPRLARVDERSK